MDRFYEQIAYKEELEIENRRLRKAIYDTVVGGSGGVLAGERIEPPRQAGVEIENYICALKVANESLEHKLAETKEQMRVFNAEQEEKAKRVMGPEFV